jgi:hypothetical protein
MGTLATIAMPPARTDARAAAISAQQPSQWGHVGSASSPHRSLDIKIA